MEFAPIVLFVYNRLDHTIKTIQALQKNKEASSSLLYIFSDAPASNLDKESVFKVRKYIHSIKGFKKIVIKERIENYGLAKSIIEGVTSVVNEHSTVIVLEDDIVTSPHFLNFMNSALSFYQEESKVWHISGWNYPIETDGLQDVFLWRMMNCWGWATWKDRWEHFEKDVDKIVKTFTYEEKKRFNLDGAENFWSQVVANKKGRINTWAIFWYATIFKANGLCINPSQTFVDNIGNDGSGVHCGENSSYKGTLSSQSNVEFTNEFQENAIALDRVQTFYKKNKKTILIKIINKISRLFSR